jgi:acetyltransferase-like isoleucine patch superfamily enzyme
LKKKLKLLFAVNWWATWRFNLKVFPFSIARKLPVFIFGKIRFSSLDGTVILDGPIETAMIGIGQTFEFPSTSKGTAELFLRGTLRFKGKATWGKDVCVKIDQGAEFEMGHMATLGSNVKVMCTQHIVFGEWTGIGYDSQVVDTNSHPFINSETKQKYPTSGRIELGAYNAISNKVTIMMNTKTSDNIVIASHSLCNTDYTPLGSEILLGGIPAKKIKDNFCRDWESEKPKLIQNKKINW